MRWDNQGGKQQDPSKKKQSLHENNLNTQITNGQMETFASPSGFYREEDYTGALPLELLLLKLKSFMQSTLVTH
jgi:hypothetical protein